MTLSGQVKDQEPGDPPLRRFVADVVPVTDRDLRR